MAIHFHKYQGTGNDFVIIDNRKFNFPKNDTNLVAQLCNRKFGIGADGLLLLEPHPQHDFNMVYYNSDGNLSSMCGNGGRCLVHFAQQLGVIGDQTTFQAVDGVHHASLQGDKISLGMNDVDKIEEFESYVFLNTGSPHHVEIVENIEAFDVFSEGRKIRNDRYGKEGANVNFVTQITADTFAVRTYERGVEAETLSCGTGVTAVAIGMFHTGKTNSQRIQLQTPGGNLEVTFEKQENRYTNVTLIGPAVEVFKGIWS